MIAVQPHQFARCNHAPLQSTLNNNQWTVLQCKCKGSKDLCTSASHCVLSHSVILLRWSPLSRGEITILEMDTKCEQSGSGAHMYWTFKSVQSQITFSSFLSVSLKENLSILACTYQFEIMALKFLCIKHRGSTERMHHASQLSATIVSSGNSWSSY